MVLTFSHNVDLDRSLINLACHISVVLPTEEMNRVDFSHIWGVADAILRISGVVYFLSCFCHCVCFSLSLPTGLLSLNSLFPSIYDIEGCATTAVSLVSGWVFTL